MRFTSAESQQGMLQTDFTATWPSGRRLQRKTNAIHFIDSSLQSAVDEVNGMTLLGRTCEV
jgi:hypothetical protein